MIEYHEPPRLAVGTRVRIKLNPSCPMIRERDPSGKPMRGHFPQEDGRTGVIAEWPEEFGEILFEHDYCVNYDKSFMLYPRLLLDGSSYSGWELEVLDE